MSSQAMEAQITLAEGGIPGLFDVELPDGREFRDLTVGQLGQIKRDLGLELHWPNPSPPRYDDIPF